MQIKPNRWFIGIGLLFILATNVVFIRLFIETPPGHQYTGIGFEAAADKLVYYSMIQQGMHGKLFMENVHTSEPQRGSLFSPHWYLIGGTASILHVPGPVSYHLYRIVFTVFFLLFLARLTQGLYERPWQQISAYAIALFSSGLGWLYFILHPGIADTTVHWMQYFNATPIDLYVTEYSAFTNTLQSPLFILSYTLILVIMLLALQKGVTVRQQVLLFFVVALLGSIHPYDLLLIGVVLGSYAIWEMVRTGDIRTVFRLWPVALGGLCAVIYQIWGLLREPALSGWLSQNIAFSPSISNYLWGLGIVLPLAVVGAWSLFRDGALDRPQWRLVILWALWMPVLVYVPMAVNRRFASTMLLPFGILACHGLLYAIARMKTYIGKVTVVVICSVLLFSGVLYQLAQHLFYQPTLAEKYSYYIDPYMSEGLRIIAERSSYDDVLLPSAGFLGILTAAYAPLKLYVGHAHQTVQYELKKNDMEWFFSEPQGPEGFERRARFLREQGITMIAIYKPSMQDSSEWLDSVPGVERVYDSIVIRLFTVQLGS